MDLRIVNTCNNDCLYCLEQELRKKESFINVQEIYKTLEENLDREILCFYGGNALLHPDIIDILKQGKKLGYQNISILTNTGGSNLEFLQLLKDAGLQSIHFYFNSFDNYKHEYIVNGGISLNELIHNIKHIGDLGFQSKAIIHVNKQNISTLYRDVYMLYKYYGIKTFEFINYFPFSRAYNQHDKILAYTMKLHQHDIERFIKIIIKIDIQIGFKKFPKKFFGKFDEYYDYDSGIMQLISGEDRDQINSSETPTCCEVHRCQSCFLQDVCKHYIHS